MSALVTLDLSRNSLEGEIPTEIRLLTDLQELLLSNNSDLSGSIPSALGLLSQLVLLKLGGTSLTGQVPEAVCALMGNGVMEAIEVDCGLVRCNCGCVCA
jgi:hypothetical protein